MSTEPARPRPPRRPPPRKIQATLALLLAGVALLAGVVVGYIANGDAEPAGLITESRELPVVTITQTVTRPVTITQTVTAPRRTTSAPAATTTAPDDATTAPSDGDSP